MTIPSRTIVTAVLLLTAPSAEAQRLAYADLSEPERPIARPEAQATEPTDEGTNPPWLQYALLDRFEWAVAPGQDGYAWDFSALVGGETDRLYLGSTGEGVSSGRLEYLELNALYSRNVGGGWDLNAGLRYDLLPHPNRAYATLGMQYNAEDDTLWLGAFTYLSHRGELSARLAAYYNQRLGDSLYLQPSLALDVSGQGVPALGIGRGLSYLEAGLRLRYGFSEHFWPYVGLSWSRDLGRTARLTRAAGDDPEAKSVVIGLRSSY